MDGNAGRKQGVVTQFNMVRGYGFIASPGELDYYLHISQIEDKRTPAIGAEVTFAAGAAVRGKRAEALEVKFVNLRDGNGKQ
jgi:cold shock CspA family protein